MLSLLCLLFHDASSDHAFLFLGVSMHLAIDLSTQEDNHKNHQRTASPWVRSLGPEFSTLFERDPRFGGTWDLDTISSFGIFLDFFFFYRGIGPCGSVPHPPLEWISSPPLVSAVFITTKGAESPGSSRMGGIGALVIFFSI